MRTSWLAVLILTLGFSYANAQDLVNPANGYQPRDLPPEELTVDNEADLVVMGGFFLDTMYPCNAGISHPQSTHPVCYKADTKEPCDPNSNDGVTSCLCYSNFGGDSITAKVMNSELGVYQSYSVSASNSEDPTTNSMFKNPWMNRIEELRINLSSERTGTRYFVDFCYAGPVEVLVYASNGLGGKTARDITLGNYLLDAQATMSDLLAGESSYAKVSGLNISTQVKCDLRYRGNYKYPRFPMEAMPTADIADPDFMYSSDEMPIDQTFMLQTMLNRGMVDVPRFCVIRYNFSETNTSSIRKWQRRMSKVSVRINVFQLGPGQ